MDMRLTSWEESYDKPTQHIIKQRHYFATKVHIVKAIDFLVGHKQGRL